MSDVALENAKALKIKALSEIARLEAELRGWHDRISMAEHFIDQWNAFASGAVENPVESVFAEQNKTAPSPVKRKAIRNSKKEDVAEAARAIIRERNAPVPRAELFQALVQRGLTMEGSDPEMVLSTMLWRMRTRVARLKSGGYWLADEPYPEGNYYPAPPEDVRTEAKTLRGLIEAENHIVDRGEEPSMTTEEFSQARARLREIEEQYPLVFVEAPDL
ncbi:hypothetical protein RFM26_24905 [Mesorhizobium sp. VK23B]|uniref:Uncharacterized protein n=1 Tax=Mesorhizobium dulcispinae TaxID=3072316 RepID=A0ABU4XKJ4_9HYPH|nr:MULTISPECIES: hypothetical protein [unclassified Mesorhizobium]MDX8468953.1 hypothetical protein [Mesorhizobium sp. VK23B]MDX8475258.1 hypothetical protein [Mesorhizobium sp. VK23A]